MVYQGPEKERRIIVKDENIQINLYFGDDPCALGRTVVQPRSDSSDISELTDDHWKTLSKWIPRVSKAMKRVLGQISGRKVQKVYLFSFNESKEYPVHFHLVPRYEGETLTGPDFLFFLSKAELMVSLQNEAKIVNGMKKELS